MAFPPRNHSLISRIFKLSYPLGAFYLLLWLLAAEAQDEQSPSEKIFELGEITVFASVSQPFYFSPYFKEIIEVPQQEPTLSLVDQLNRLPGIRTTRYGGWGGFTTLSIRGSSPSQVLILWNGIPLNLGYTGIVNLSDLPLETIKRVEVYKSFAPVEMGTGAIGGAVNLISYGFQPNARFSSFASSYSTGKFAVFLPFQNHWVTVAGESSKGNFPFYSDSGTPYNQHDDFQDIRRNNAYQALEGAGRFQWGKNFSRWTVDAEMYTKKQGLPGIYNNQAKYARFNPQRRLISVTTQQNWKGVRGNFLGYYLRQKDHFIDPEGEVSLLPQDSLYLTNTWGTHAYLAYPLSSSHLLSTSLHYRNETFQSKGKTLTPPTGTAQRHSLFFGLEDTFGISDKWGASFQAGWESVENKFQTKKRESLLSGHAGMTYRLHRHYSLKGNIGKAYRIPNFTELFGDRGFVIGNPNLLPEKSLNMDIGVNYSTNRKSVTLSYFESHPVNLILYWQNSQRTIKAFNLDKAKIKGLEWSVQSQWQNYDIFANYTYQRAVDEGVSFWRGNFLPSRPVHDAFLRLQHNLLMEPPVSIQYEFAFTGKNYLDRANQIVSRGIRTHTLRLGVERSLLVYTLEIRNIGNARGSDSLGFPLPGRSWLFSVSTPVH